jgi:hypothetical protein
MAVATLARHIAAARRAGVALLCRHSWAPPWQSALAWRAQHASPPRASNAIKPARASAGARLRRFTVSRDGAVTRARSAPHDHGEQERVAAWTAIHALTLSAGKIKRLDLSRC